MLLSFKAEMAVKCRSEVGYTQPKSSMSCAKREVKMSMFGMIFMMAKSTRKRINESAKYEASGKTHRRLEDY